MIDIRFIKESDKEFWFSLDGHISEAEFYKKVRDGQGYIVSEDGFPVGILRYNLLWDNTPFLNQIYIDEPYRGLGYGKALIEYWERDMAAKGCKTVLTSTRVDETAQHFYRKLGYRDCGGFVIDIKGYEQPMELFMIKGLR